MMNKVILMGRVGKQPESRYTTSGTQVVSFSLATSERYKDKNGEKKEDTCWHNLILWKKVAEIAEKYVNKGDQILVEGKINNRSYEDKEGTRKYISEVVVNNLHLLSKPKTEQPQNEAGPREQQYNQSQGEKQIPFDEDSEIPF